MAEINREPCCLFAHCGACQGIDQEQLLKDVTKKHNLPEYDTIVEDILGFTWNFETKYYTCTVKLCKTNRPVLGSQQFADDLEVVILVFDPNEVDSWTSVTSWLSYLSELEPYVKMLVCNSCTESDLIPKAKVQQWCIDNEFELIELQADDAEDEFDVDGVQRIIQVMHAHTWSNLVMKDKPDTVSPYMKKLMDESKVEAEAAAGQEQSEIDICSELGMNTKELTDMLHDDGEAGVESFEKLFSSLHLMKEKAESLAPEERKSYAEKVALSFWSAIGGSDDEIDLSD
ncbi:alpha- and gamma-adaptin-binding protein p34-like isoform X2 [Watersipora subatra]|uniref:alpha- and gamma-adaptin-binding protein p34-like isoform X2 n=1 Tax=Watersipora subatra TaxID=2589382 RepID=UPI00355C0592